MTQSRSTLPHFAHELCALLERRREAGGSPRIPHHRYQTRVALCNLDHWDEGVLQILHRRQTVTRFGCTPTLRISAQQSVGEKAHVSPEKLFLQSRYLRCKV